jgi:hypothetical protein
LQARQTAGGAPIDLPVASGLASIESVRTFPALFRLMFASERPYEWTPELSEAGAAALRHFVEDMAQLRRRSPSAVPWPGRASRHSARARGTADLGCSENLVQSVAEREREAFLRGMMACTLG